LISYVSFFMDPIVFWTDKISYNLTLHSRIDVGWF
jgi:hypothetical protein